jgi:hypothetical protein
MRCWSQSKVNTHSQAESLIWAWQRSRKHLVVVSVRSAHNDKICSLLTQNIFAWWLTFAMWVNGWAREYNRMILFMPGVCSSIKNTTPVYCLLKSESLSDPLWQAWAVFSNACPYLIALASISEKRINKIDALFFNKKIAETTALRRRSRSKLWSVRYGICYLKEKSYYRDLHNIKKMGCNRWMRTPIEKWEQLLN